MLSFLPFKEEFGMNPSPASIRTPLKVSTRLFLLTSSLGLLLILVGGIGIWGMSQIDAALKTVYEDRTVPATQLAQIESLTLRNQMLLQESLIDLDAARTVQRVAQIDQNIATVTSTWARYTSTYLTPEEKRLADQFAQVRGQFVAGGLGPIQAALKDGDHERARRILNNELPALYAPVRDSLAALLKLQIDVAKAEYDVAEARYHQVSAVAIGAMLLALGLAALLGFWIARSIRHALGAEPHEVRQVAESVAAGRLDTVVQVRPGDEVSVMATMKRMSDTLTGIVTEVRENAESVAMASTQIAAGNVDLSSRTEEQASALQQTAASMEELSSAVQHNADNARQANQLAGSASSVATQGGQVMIQVVETMKGIQDSSHRIADIIGVIDGIAFQTNILALNAAVEAARAGEQGRGFAVVASEVRALAQRSAQAAGEVKSLIQSSNERVEQGSALVERAGATMREIEQSIARVTDIMGEISSASLEQASGVGQVNDAVTQMDQTTQQNAALVEQSAAAAESLRTQAGQLVQAVAVFSLPHAARSVAREARPGPAPSPAVLARGAVDKAKANAWRSSAQGKILPSAKAAPGPRLRQAVKPAAGDGGDWAAF
jgi:methyl-accepting chemotaxis protein